MKSRVIGTVLFGFGVLALVFAGGLAFVVAPSVAQLPYDMELTQSVAEAPNARFMQITNGEVRVNSGNLRSTITVQPDAGSTAKLSGDLDGSALVWVAGQQVQRTDTADMVSAYSTALVVDRVTGAAQDWDGQWLDTGGEREPVEYSGQTYKFPFGTEKKTYQIYDRDILAARDAVFVKTEEIQGLETYQFTQTITNETQKVPADRLSVILGALLPGATDGSVKYSNIRNYWVEPNTGAYIRVQEQQRKQLVSTDGRSVDILDADFAYTDETVTKSADTAKANVRSLKLAGVWGPIGLAILGLVLAVAGVLLVIRSGRAAQVAVPGQWAGTPRHAAKDAGDDETTQVTSDKA
jgi:Porin PorA